MQKATRPGTKDKTQEHSEKLPLPSRELGILKKNPDSWIMLEPDIRRLANPTPQRQTGSA